ncbi:helicase-related protein [Paracoccaceae bacterium]|nr:helicase-related protein [Paracoccaceae bacterium]
MEKEIKPDVICSMGDAINEGFSRPLEFIALDGVFKWDEDGELITASFDDQLSEEKSRRRLRVALGGRSSFKRDLFNHANNRLNDIRAYEQSNAANLIFTTDIREAEIMKEIIIQETGITPPIIHNQLADASSVFEDFKNGTDPHIITVKMINEGANVKRARLVTYATIVKEALTFEQIVTRVCRKEHFQQTGPGYIFMPNDPDLVEMAQNIEGMTLRTILPVDDGTKATKQNLNSSSSKTFIPISAQANGYNGIYRGQFAGKVEMNLAKVWRSNHPNVAHSISDVDLANVLATQQLEDQVSQPEISAPVPEETHDEKVRRFKKRIQHQVNRLAHIKNREPKEIHRKWLDLGKPKHAISTIEDLKSKSDWLDAQIEKSIAQEFIASC